MDCYKKKNILNPQIQEQQDRNAISKGWKSKMDDEILLSIWITILLVHLM